MLGFFQFELVCEIFKCTFIITLIQVFLVGLYGLSNFLLDKVIKLITDSGHTL